MRTLTAAAVCLALSSAFLLYGLNYDTRLIEARVHDNERLAEQARTDIAILKAERAHLARPERIEALARAAGLRPATGQQYFPIETGSTDTAAAPGATPATERETQDGR